MKEITIIGMGTGADTLTVEGMRAAGRADMIIGAARLLKAVDSRDGQMLFEESDTGKIARTVRKCAAQRCAVLVSGDPGFYSAAGKLYTALANEKVTVLPGVSSLNCFFAKLARPWQEAALISCHGREANLADTVRRNRLTFALTGGNVNELSDRLVQAGFGGLCVYAGENMGAHGERIVKRRAGDLPAAQLKGLTVLLIENPEADGRVRFGLPDDLFVRGKVPMTKEEVRAVILSRLAIAPGEACCDIGCGSGSVTVEMAMAAYNGCVYAIDRKREALGLMRENCRAFHIGNVKEILGSAPGALMGLPPLDAAFIGGSGGKMRAIIGGLMENNPSVRIVLSAISIENVQEGIAAFTQNGLQAKMVQISAARAKYTAGLHLLSAQNPVFIISGGGNE